MPQNDQQATTLIHLLKEQAEQELNQFPGSYRAKNRLDICNELLDALKQLDIPIKQEVRRQKRAYKIRAKKVS